jgi:hypothetical protein
MRYAGAGIATDSKIMFSRAPSRYPPTEKDRACRIPLVPRQI